MALGVDARQISLEEAQSIASEFFNSSPTSKAKKVHSCTISATVEHISDPQPYYIFNASGNAGFVIISGDTRAKKILGYSDRGSFDTDNMAPQLKTLLEQYAKSIELIPASHKVDESWVYNETLNSEGGILLETANWGQGYPYNAQCPIIDGIQAPSGCVATAMAIIMKYHNWPERGRGKIYYNFNKDEFLNCSDLIISWDVINDLDGIVEDNTRNKEISNLLYYCGRATNTAYGVEDSSTPCYTIASAMRRYFDYNSSIKRIQRQYYNEEQWISIIQNEIANNRPILYDGVDTSTSVGHCFVVDGYNAEGFFHINWGWNGRNNGYFNLNNLTTNNYSFINCQSAIVGIAPSDDYDMTWSDCYLVDEKDDYYLYSAPYPTDFHVSVEELKKGEFFDVVTPTIVLPPSWDEVTKIGIALVDKNQNIKEIVGYNEFYKNVENQPTGYNGAFRRCKVQVSDIDSSDLLYLATYEPNDNVWKLIKSQSNLPSYCSIQNLHGDFTHLTFEIEDPLIPFVGDASYGEDLSNGDIKLLKNLTLDIGTSCETRNILSAIKINEKKWSLSTPGVNPGGSLTLTENSYHIECIAHPVNQNNTLEIYNPTFGGLANLIEKEELIHCDNLSIDGEIDEDDINYLSNNMLFANSVCFNCDIINSIIPPSAFSLLTNLRELSVPEGIETIEELAFAYSGLKQVYLPSTIKRLGDACFWTNSQIGPIEAIYLKAEEPPLLGGHQVFIDPHETMLYVPKGCIDKYSSLPQWNIFKEIKEIPNITLNETDVTLNEGQTLQLYAVISPVHSKHLQWSSSNEAVATVDKLGLVTAVAPGNAVITVYSTDGSNISTTCDIIVNKYSGINDIIIDDNEIVKIFNISGLLIFDGKYTDAKLSEGIYIIATKYGRYKLLIK